MNTSKKHENADVNTTKHILSKIELIVEVICLNIVHMPQQDVP